MAEYIEREKLKTAMMKYGFRAPNMTVTEFVEDELPAADVAPVVHGRWSKRFRNGSIPLEGWVSSCCDMWNEHRANYCPNCGAKMDGGEGE